MPGHGGTGRSGNLHRRGCKYCQVQWVVVVPAKRLAEAKTRLRNGTPVAAHTRLVLAMTQDTVRAVLASPVVAEVLVVTDDPQAAVVLDRLGATVVPDRPAAGLNAAIAYGSGVAVRSRRWTAALASDLPALRPTELTGALSAAVEHPQPAFVRDASGAGTTLLTAPPGSVLDPRFGPDSAARHAASGARALDGDWPSLRRDVDTRSDLAAAAELGLGPYTSALMAHQATPSPVALPRSRRSGHEPGADG